MKLPDLPTHQNGEVLEPKKRGFDLIFDQNDNKVSVETFGGQVHVEWAPQAAVTPLGQLAFFIEFLKMGNLLEPWIEDCPLHWNSPNAPSKRDVLAHSCYLS